MSRPKGTVLHSSKEGPRDLKPRSWDSSWNVTSLISQILESAVYIFGGGGFRVGKGEAGVGRDGGRHPHGSYTGLADRGRGRCEAGITPGPF